MKFRQKSRKTEVFIVMLSMMSLFLVPKAHSTTVGEITQALTCTCGCNMLVGACEGSMECTAAKNITAQVNQLIDEGRSKDEIITSLVKIYGERILAAPTKKGFNLIAWIIPFFAILLAGGGIYFFLNRCLDSGRDSSQVMDSPGQKQNPDQKYLDQFENEWQDYGL